MKQIIAGLALVTVLRIGAKAELLYNPPVDGGPYYGDWEWVADGEITDAGFLEMSSVDVAPGEPIPEPRSLYPTITSGQKRRLKWWDSGYSEWEPGAVPYTGINESSVPSSLAIPDTYIYPVTLRALPSEPICSPVTASAGTFTVKVWGNVDSDYDGFLDWQEARSGSDPNSADNTTQARLNYWSFDTSDWLADSGTAPLAAAGVELVVGRRGYAVKIDQPGGALLQYPELQSNEKPNLNCRRGTIRFWFKPDWSSTTSGGSGPGAEGRLFEVGNQSASPTGWFALLINSSGTEIRFVVQGSGSATTILSRTINWNSSTWYQVALTYSPSGSALYINGALVGSAGPGVPAYPDESVRRAGFRVGSDASGEGQAKGRFDDLETFNYELSADSIAASYARSIATGAPNETVCDLRPIALPQSSVPQTLNSSFTVTLGPDSGNFGWLIWNNNNESAVTLANSLKTPDSRNYRNPDVPGDNIVSRNDWVYGTPGLKAGVVDSLQWLKNNATVLIVPTYAAGGTRGTGANLQYRVSGFIRVRLTAFDFKGANKTLTFMFLGAQNCDAIVNQPPTVHAGTGGTFPLPSTVALNGEARDDGLPDPPGSLTVSWSKVRGPGMVIFGSPHSAITTARFSALGEYVLRLTASDSEFARSADVTVELIPPPLPPDLTEVAPPLDGTTATTLTGATEFLYHGPDPVQFDVTPGAIETLRAAVLRGRVMDAGRNALAGVAVTILAHPEFGTTFTRQDGMFDMAVNGGGQLTINYQKPGFISTQRQVNAAIQDYTFAPDVIMIPYDSEETPVQFGSQSPAQIARGSEVNDLDGFRQNTVFFPAGTTALLEFQDGSTQPVSNLRIHATEYTVGADGPASMPAPLPPSSGYTYAVELNATEAVNLGATCIRFNQPVFNYVENYLGFPVGTRVPAGYYDRTRGLWIPSENGRVIKVVSIGSDGMANIDTTGDGFADNDPQLGISNAERTQLASLYDAGDSIWRVPVPHFTPWDYNWPYGPPDDAEPPKQPSPTSDDTEDDPCKGKGSIIEIQNQILQEAIAVVGTPFSLHYSSDRAAGRTAARTLKIPLTGSSPPPSLKAVHLEIYVAGRLHRQTFRRAPNPAPNLVPNLTWPFVWDGKDAFGRTVQGRQTATIRIGYVYEAQYQEPAQFERSFGQLSGIPITRTTSGGEERDVTLWQETRKPIGHWDARALGLGSWNVSAHHVYDPNARIIQYGTGERRSARNENNVCRTIAGNRSLRGQFGYPSTDAPDGASALTANLNDLPSIAVGPDGSVYVTDNDPVGSFGFSGRVRRMTPEGTIMTVAGGGANDPSDGGLAIHARLKRLAEDALAIGPDGTLYIAEWEGDRIRKVNPQGIISTVAGTGIPGYSGDGFPAISAQLDSPNGVALGPDGTLYIADSGNNRIRRVSPDGIITTVPGTQVDIFVYSVAVGPDGSLYFSTIYDFYGGLSRIWRIGTDGGRVLVAGGGTQENVGGIPGTQAQFSGGIAGAMGVGSDGSLYFAGGYPRRYIWQLGVDGILRIFAGDPNGTLDDNAPASQTRLFFPIGAAIGPKGDIFITDGVVNAVVYSVTKSLPGSSLADIVIPSEDGSELYVFNAAGRHLRTLDALTGTVPYQFGYNAAGLLVTVTDMDNNVTTIERDGNGNATAIVGPYGARTALGPLDANGYLASIQNPAGETVSFSYSADGLLLSMTDARLNTYTYQYDAEGRLIHDANPASGFTHLNRADVPNGYKVTSTSAMGRVAEYRVENLPTGEQRRINTGTDGAQTTTIIRSDGLTQTTSPDGAEFSVLEGPDPRWGMQAPLPKRVTTRMPSGLLESVITTERTVTLADPADPMSIETQTDTVTINDRPYTTIYEAAARTFSSVSPEGRLANTVIDDKGRIIESAINGIHPVHFSYDTQGRLETITQGSGPEARSVTFAYNTAGYLQSLADPLLRTTSFIYDNAGRVTQQTLPGSRVITLSYDANGNVTSITPPSRPAHEFDFTAVDLVSDYVPPVVTGSGNNRTRYFYNFDQQPTQILRPDGQTIDFGYDTAGRVQTITTPRGVTTYAYNGPLCGCSGIGRPSSITAPGGGVISYTYDGELLKTTTWAGTVAGSVGRAYDNDFRITSLTVNGAPVAFGYDDDSLLTSAGSLTIARAANNGLVTGTALDSVTDTRDYNSFGEPASYTADYNSTELYSVSYTRDNLGRIETKTEIIGGQTHVYDYGYDVAGRLETVTKDSTLISQYTYGANDNRDTLVTAAGTTRYTYDDQDRLLQVTRPAPLLAIDFSYTANGELATRTIGSDRTTYGYDVLGNLMEVTLPDGTEIEYLVDALNRRIGKRVNGTLAQGFLYQDGLKVIAELDDSGNVASRFVYGGKVNVPEYMIKGSATYRIITDHLGSPRLVVNVANGAIAQRMDYDEFGNVVQDTKPGFQPFGFAGGIYDTDTKLVRFGVRDYDAEIGRWTSKEPLGFSGSINWYAYAFNDPINLVDINGLWTIGFGFTFSYGFGIGGSVSIGFHYGKNEETGASSKGVLITSGLGAGFPPNIFAGGFFQRTNAKCVKQLKGLGYQLGAGGGEGVGGGADLVGGRGYQGFDVQGGATFGLPIEGHALGTLSFGWDTDKGFGH